MSSAAAVDGGPVYISVQGSGTIPAGDRAQYLVTVIGGPGSLPGGNFSFVAKVVGPNIGDAFVAPSSGLSATGVFRINVTAPTTPQDIILIVNVTSSSLTLSERGSTFYPIRVLSPVSISATVKNTGAVEVNGIPVAIYADGRKVHETSISLKASSSTVVRYNWTDPDMTPGQHVITVVIDPNSEFVGFETGGTVYTTTIYIGRTDYGTTNALLAVLFVVSLVLIVIVYRRPKKRRMR